MKSKKIIWTLILTLTLATTSAMSIPSIVNAKTVDNPTIKGTIQKHNIASGNFKIGDKNVKVSNVLTFDQVVKMIAKDNNITTDQAANQVVEKFYKDNISQNTSMTENLASSKITNFLSAKMLAERATYRSVTSTFDVNYAYHPSLNFYCETSEGDYMWGILKILNVGMNRYDDGMSKQFSGTVYSNLENGGEIFWTVNGDFFNNGTTTGSGSVNIGIGQSASVSFSVSYSSNHYAYCYQEGKYEVSF